MARAVLALTFVIASLPAFAATDDELRQQLVGSWAETPECTGQLLTFKGDGTFITGDTADDPADDRKGTYKVADGKLTGEAEGRAMPEVTLRIEGDKLFFDGEGGSSEAAVRCTKEPTRKVP